MAKSNRKYSKNSISLSSEENDFSSNGKKEKYPSRSRKSRNTRRIILCVFISILTFVFGLIIGFFISKSEICGNNDSDDIKSLDLLSKNLQLLLTTLDKEEMRRYFR